MQRVFHAFPPTLILQPPLSLIRTELVLVPVLDRGHTAIAKGLSQSHSAINPTRRKTAKNTHH